MPSLSPQVATNYTFEQTGEASTWVITHNLQRYPVVDVFILNEGDIERIMPDTVTYTNKNTVTLGFSAPRAGYVTVV